MIDEVVVALADLSDAYAAVAVQNETKLHGDAREVAMLAYEIMCGERVSWDRTYGSDRRVRLGDSAGRVREVEDEIVDGMKGLKVVRG